MLESQGRIFYGVLGLFVNDETLFIFSHDASKNFFMEIDHETSCKFLKKCQNYITLSCCSYKTYKRLLFFGKNVVKTNAAHKPQ